MICSFARTDSGFCMPVRFSSILIASNALHLYCLHKICPSIFLDSELLFDGADLASCVRVQIALLELGYLFLQLILHILVD